MFGSPILTKKFEITSSNLSCPTSMQSVCLMVLTFIFLSLSLAATSRGARGFSMRAATGVLWSGTLRCLSIFAAAEDCMGLRPGGNEGMAISLLGRAPGELGEGIPIASPQEGQLISL